MDWIQCLSNALGYIEEHLTDEIVIDDISKHSYSSPSHFQLIFHLVMGITIGEYIRNRRLSEAARDLHLPGKKIADIALRYKYDTQESFSKAFTRFHGISPSKIQKGNIKNFKPLTINITIQGGFDMATNLANEFYWNDIENLQTKELTDAEKYQIVVNWAAKARGRNPNVFDALTEWILDDANWTEDKLKENEQILMHGVFARFKEQNSKLRTYLKELEPSGVVNQIVFDALNNFDEELSGNIYDDRLREAVSRVFNDFSAMLDPNIRKLFAGEKTGPTGTDSVETFGYINYLKGCDAGVQWALFMPGLVEHQQKGFKIDSFEYKKLPAMRFIGKLEEDGLESLESRKEIFSILDSLESFKSGFDYDVMLAHHYGKGVNIGPAYCYWGRFMMVDTPVPDGFTHFDFVPENDGKAGLPFISHVAFAIYSGDIEALHSSEGYDVHAMYDITRNVMLGQGVNIPYPNKYWNAEVFLDGYDKPSTAYLFSAELS